MKIAIIAAMEKEISLIRQINNPDICVYQSGIGKVSAALKTLEIIKNQQPDLIISSGVAGGLESGLKLGEIVASDRLCYHDVWCGEPNSYGQVQGLPLFFKADSKVLSMLDSNIKQGLIISGDQFISNPEDVYSLKQKFPKALAVDMESAAIAQTCFLYNVPFVSLRLISDVPGSENHQEEYDLFWKNAANISFEHLNKFLKKITQL